MNIQSDGAIPQPRRSSLDALIADLEGPNSDDPQPSTTRATVKLLRILQTCGPEEMLDAISSNIHSSIAALRVVAPSTADATQGFLLLAATHVKTWLECDVAKATKPTKSK